MNKFIYIFGTSYCGKSTLVRNVFHSDCEGNTNLLIPISDFKKMNCEFGIYSQSNGGRYIGVGRYDIGCGGADTINKFDDLRNLIVHLGEKNVDKNIICERYFLNSFDRYISLFDEVSNTHEVNVIFLTSSLAQLENRKKNRTGLIEVKMGYAEDTQKKIYKLKDKFLEDGRYKIFHIDTSNLNEDEVLRKFFELLQI